MTRLTVRVDDLPESFEPYGKIVLRLQTKKGFQTADGGTYRVQLDRKANRKGELHWVGDAVHFHGDGRRFIYLSWQGERGEQFRRIKLYLDQIPNLDDGDVEVTISGTMKDGTPACSTARIVD